MLVDLLDVITVAEIYLDIGVPMKTSWLVYDKVDDKEREGAQNPQHRVGKSNRGFVSLGHFLAFCGHWALIRKADDDAD